MADTTVANYYYHYWSMIWQYPIIFSTQDSQHQRKTKVNNVKEVNSMNEKEMILKSLFNDSSGDSEALLSTFSDYLDIFPKFCHLKTSWNQIKPGNKFKSQYHHLLTVWLQFVVL